MFQFQKDYFGCSVYSRFDRRVLKVRLGFEGLNQGIGQREKMSILRYLESGIVF